MLTAEQYDRGWGGPLAILVAIAVFKIAIEAWQWWQARRADAAEDEADELVLADDDEPRPASWWERALDRAGVWTYQDREPLPSPTGEVGSDTDDPEVTVGSDPRVTAESNRVPVVVYRDDKPLLGPAEQRRAALPGWVRRELSVPPSKRKGHNMIVREGARIHGVSQTTVKRAIAAVRGRRRR